MTPRRISQVANSDFRDVETGDPKISLQIFGRIFAIHIVIIAALLILAGGDFHEVSRDSAWYHIRGVEIAEKYATGNVNWGNWIDEGWYEFVGLVYFIFGPHLLIVLIINSIMASVAAVLVYRVATLVFDSERVGRTAAHLFALFPSIVYYSSLPLKESAALFAHVGTVWGILQITVLRKGSGWKWIIAGLVIIAAIRIYLFYVLVACTLICLVPVRHRPGITGVFQTACVILGLGILAIVCFSAIGVDVTKYEHFQYFDLNYINEVRADMSAGKSRIYDDASEATFGEDWLANAKKAVMGIWYFFVVVDVTSIRRARQWAALPEVLFLLYCMIPLIYGVIYAWRRDPRRVLPIILWAVVLVAVYSGATTNGGAMYRWRIQAMPFLIMLIVYGFAVIRRGAIYHLMRRLKPAPGSYVVRPTS